LDKLEEEDIPGLLMLVDFEKAFDTVEYYGFGPTLTKWVKSVHTNIVSAVINNGHLPELFLLERSDNVILYLHTFLEFLSSPNINVESSAY
jgi:hypothetical protein